MPSRIRRPRDPRSSASSSASYRSPSSAAEPRQRSPIPRPWRRLHRRGASTPRRGGSTRSRAWPSLQFSFGLLGASGRAERLGRWVGAGRREVDRESVLHDRLELRTPHLACRLRPACHRAPDLSKHSSRSFHPVLLFPTTSAPFAAGLPRPSSPARRHKVEWRALRHAIHDAGRGLRGLVELAESERHLRAELGLRETALGECLSARLAYPFVRHPTGDEDGVRVARRLRRRDDRHLRIALGEVAIELRVEVLIAEADELLRAEAEIAAPVARHQALLEDGPKVGPILGRELRLELRFEIRGREAREFLGTDALVAVEVAHRKAFLEGGAEVVRLLRRLRLLHDDGLDLLRRLGLRLFRLGFLVLRLGLRLVALELRDDLRAELLV